MDFDKTILALWGELRSCVEAVEIDVMKNARGVSAAGVRARKGLRELKAKTSALVKLTIELDKAKPKRPKKEVA